MKSTLWIRMNGQQELRDNVRRSIREAGLTQAQAAEEAGMKRSRLVGFLSENTWWDAEDVEAIARVLAAHEHTVTAEDLLGGSILRTDRDGPNSEKFWAFNYRPTRFNDPPAASESPKEPSVPTRALCCTCGHLRRVDVRNGEHEQVGEGNEERWTLDLQCKNCDATTAHALLRFGAHADYAEQRDHSPTRSSLAANEMTELVDRLIGFNVDVVFRGCRRSYRKKEYALSYDFDDSKSRWRIEVDPNLPSRVQVSLLTSAWKSISTNDFGDIDWDPRTTGTMSSASDRVWERAADDLLEDIRRYMLVERRRLVQHVRQEVAARSEVETS